MSVRLARRHGQALPLLPTNDLPLPAQSILDLLEPINIHLDVGRSLLRTSTAQLQMSARAFHRVLKLSRTIADLAG
jgi:predicted ATPase with chaperone activity